MNEERKEWPADQNSLKDSGNRRKDDQSHEREKDRRNTRNSDQNASQPQKREAKEERRKTKPCWFVEKGHECPYGENGCWFSHEKLRPKPTWPTQKMPAQNKKPEKLDSGKEKLEPDRVNEDRNKKTEPPKNGPEGMQQIMQLHTVYSLLNQLKQQSMDIKELKRVVARRY